MYQDSTKYQPKSSSLVGISAFVADSRRTARVRILLSETLKRIFKRVAPVNEKLSENARLDTVHLFEASNIALARFGHGVDQVPIAFCENVHLVTSCWVNLTAGIAGVCKQD